MSQPPRLTTHIASFRHRHCSLCSGRTCHHSRIPSRWWPSSCPSCSCRGYLLFLHCSPLFPSRSSLLKSPLEWIGSNNFVISFLRIGVLLTKACHNGYLHVRLHAFCSARNRTRVSCRVCSSLETYLLYHGMAGVPAYRHRRQVWYGVECGEHSSRVRIT